VTTERAQDPSVICSFLREEIFRLLGIFAKFFLGLERLDFPVVAYEKADKVDVLLEDGLCTDKKTIKPGDQRAQRGGTPQRGIF